MKYCDEMTKSIADFLTAGNNRTDTCTLADISYDTFTVWMQKPEFSAAIKKAEATFKERNIVLIQTAAIKSWQAAAWLLERKYRDEFALRVEDHGRNKDELNKQAIEAATQVLKVLEEAANAAESRARERRNAPGLANGTAQIQTSPATGERI